MFIVRPAGSVIVRPAGVSSSGGAGDVGVRRAAVSVVRRRSADRRVRCVRFRRTDALGRRVVDRSVVDPVHLVDDAATRLWRRARRSGGGTTRRCRSSGPSDMSPPRRSPATRPRWPRRPRALSRSSPPARRSSTPPATPSNPCPTRPRRPTPRASRSAPRPSRRRSRTAPRSNASGRWGAEATTTTELAPSSMRPVRCSSTRRPTVGQRTLTSSTIDCIRGTTCSSYASYVRYSTPSRPSAWSRTVPLNNTTAPQSGRTAHS